ncbi:type II toxin-antitoxin system Phd/YefM family antitoxin [Clostridium tagluense]|uniref:Antitoxin n=1 Tax=Clostridium tagluense TaxID=360422 RepID=A0A401USX4_9CLOT|nr:type II toxin-antitoxin system Phd/YefM family antitoxin [Clostridium tagluense]GCD12637.1 hypothetical protein Ctaglu_42600 [Clostridium tagluense]
MKIANLKDLMVGLSDFKKQLSEIVSNKMTKIIVKNNEPVSIILPYEDYLKMTGDIEEGQGIIRGTGQDITLVNGVQIMVVVETGVDGISADSIAIKTYIKMKTTKQYKLHYTLKLGSPNVDQTYTIEEQVQMMNERNIENE